MKIPYQMVAAMPVPERLQQMAIAIAQGFPRLGAVPIREGESVSIACYGPSLADTYSQMTRPIISMSGATRFLADRGIVPDFHIDMEPRVHKVKHLEPPVDGVTYLMASVCHPQTWEVLKGQKVVLWHTNSGAGTAEWLAQHDPGQLLVKGGSSIGLTALHIGGLLGFRHFEIHGMDNSKRDGQRHAGPHYGHAQGGYTWQANNVVYDTSRIMSNACAEMINYLDAFPIFCVFHGEGLMQALVQKHNAANACRAGEAEKAATVRRARAQFFDTNDPLAAEVAIAKDRLPVEEIAQIRSMYDTCESFRSRAHFNTGSVSLDACLMLRSLCELWQPRTIAEIGTFIGRTTCAMRASDAIYTCDKDNDCLPIDPPTPCRVVQFPKQTSTQMLTALQGQQIDLFLFDGRIQPQDVPLIQALSHERTIFVFDDFNGEEKGVVNCRTLWPMVPTYRRTRPSALWGDTTLAILSPTLQWKAA